MEDVESDSEHGEGTGGGGSGFDDQSAEFGVTEPEIIWPLDLDGELEGGAEGGSDEGGSCGGDSVPESLRG